MKSRITSGSKAFIVAVIFLAALPAALIGAPCGCGGPRKNSTVGPGGEACTSKPGTGALEPGSYNKLFEKGQAAYYVQEDKNLLLAARIKKESNAADMIGKLLILIITSFDFICDKREKIILVCYKGHVAESDNVGMVVNVSDIRLFQEEKIDIGNLADRSQSRERVDLSSVSSVIYK
ncbi:MAG: hypothetical protein ABIJ56_21050 [Pseudomonadota bacterium]